MQNKPVVIIGGGLSGLTCALLLKRQGFQILVLESETQVGGRLKTIEAEPGFKLDVGFQVLLNSYPELNGLIDLDQLRLKKFNSGALILRKDRGQIKSYLLANPLIHPGRAVWELFSNQVELADQALVLKLISRAYSQKKTQAPPISTIDFLRVFGFTQKFIDSFWRPFLTGVFLDPHLSLDSEYFLFLMKCFSGGFVSVPENGMSMIPQQMAKEIGAENIRTSSGVASFNDKEVRLQTGELIRASLVICAYNKSPHPQDFLDVKTHYFSTDQALPWEKWLVLIPSEMGLKVNHMAVMSDVNPYYSQSGKHLLSVSEVGTSSDSKQVQREVQSLLPSPVEFKLVNSFHIRRALPKLRHKAPGYEFVDGIFYCGDHLSSPSINGALRSGRLVSEQVLRRLKSEDARSISDSNSAGALK